jgi:hypothetical protein
MLETTRASSAERDDSGILVGQFTDASACIQNIDTESAGFGFGKILLVEDDEDAS